MDMLECIEKRRSVSVYKDAPIPDEVLEKILDAGRWAPSGANSQPVELVVVKDRKDRERIRSLVLEVWQMSGVDSLDTVFSVMRESGSLAASGAEVVSWDEYLNAPVMVIVVSDEDKRGQEYEHITYYTMSSDAGAATCQNMMLGAYALGVGSLWLTAVDPERIKYWFGVPRTLGVAGIVLLGYPKYWPQAPELVLSTDPRVYPRRPLAELVHYETFDNEKWIDYQLNDPFRLPRKEFLRTQNYIRPTSLKGD
jgi:nitroreductase